MANIDLNVVADITGLRKALESIPGITAPQARAMAAELNKSFKAAERAARDAAATSRKAMEETEASARDAAQAVDNVGVAAANAGQNFGRMGTDASKLAGALGMVSPELGNIARSGADLADAFEVAAGSGVSLLNILGPVAIAAGAAAAAHALLSRNLREVEERNNKAAESARRMAEATAMVTGNQEELDLQYHVAAGNLSEREAAEVRATKAIKERYRASEELLIRQRDEAKQTIDQLGLDIRQVGTVNAARQALAAKEEQLAALNQRREREIGLVHETLRLREENTKRTERGTRATKKHSEAVKDEAEAIDESLLMFQELAKRVNDYTAGMEELSSISQYFLSDEERLTLEYAKQKEEIRALTTELETLATTEEMRQEAAIQGSIALAAAEKKYSDEVQKLRDEAAEERAKADAEEEARIKDLLDKARAEAEERDALRRQQAQAAAEAIGQIVSTVTDGIERSADEAASTLASMEGDLAANRDQMTEAERQALKERIETQRQQARKQFEIAKLGRIAEATIATAASVANALATPPAPNLLLAGLAGATGAAQLAAIASVQPAFHSGGMVPDETQARLLTGEAVLSRTGRNMIGDQQINRANAGMSQPVQVVAVQQYRHRVFNEFVKDNLKIGSPISAAIRGTRTVGMREAV